MASRAFDEFVQREQAAAKEAGEPAVDWQAEKAQWLRHLDELFRQVNEYLKPYLDAGQIAVEYSKIDLNEEHIGPYSAPLMLITIGSKKIKLEPVGTFLIGSRGRVDVVGPVARAQLILLDSEVKSLSQLIHVSVGFGGNMPAPPPARPRSRAKLAWRIVTRPPRREIVEINKETFLSILLEIANG